MWLESAKYAPPGIESLSSDEVKAYLYSGKVAIATELKYGIIKELGFKNL